MQKSKDYLNFAKHLKFRKNKRVTPCEKLQGVFLFVPKQNVHNSIHGSDEEQAHDERQDLNAFFELWYHLP